jgi:putative ABC transport system permease protein
VLFVIVADHLAEYATLKAVGFTDGSLVFIVLQQAVLLAVLGFVPGLLLSYQFYKLAAQGTLLPLQLTLGTCLVVFALTVLMCSEVSWWARVSAHDGAPVLATLPPSDSLSFVGGGSG